MGAGSIVRIKAWKKIVVVLVTGIVAISLLMYWERFDIAVWYMEGNKNAQESLILQMVEYARPAIKSEFKMDLFERIFSALAGKRSQKERRADALKDVRAFCASSFEDHRLKFMNVRNRGSLNGFDLHGFDLALGWNRGKTDEVLLAFNIDFLKRTIGAIQLNENCSFFTDLRAYVEKRAKEN